ncbi:MAG: selenide, water dikinase SelD [Planctomycetota bacterium]|nr:selenide, water dikinase SelD [Planctomycetota bacterium]
MPQGQLAQVLRDVLDVDDERLLVGPRSMDDAGVVMLGEGEGLPAGTKLALVQTVDYFPPVVDDPHYYGAIAAANALSDVYAMGGRPLSALSLASFPKEFDQGWRAEILRAGFEKVRAAGAVVAGGHTIESEVQFGFAITGLIDPDRVMANSGARAGDLAYLTKPIGMGCMTTAAKLGKITWDELEPAARQMATLNDLAAEAMEAALAHACTDITGFGLIGHAMNIARASDVTFRIRASDVPIFPGAMEQAKKKRFSGQAERGRESLGDDVAIGGGLEEVLVGLLFDAETSGGLLIVLPPERAGVLEDELRARDLPVVCVGEFVEAGEKRIELS